jgi:hypothetical protein
LARTLARALVTSLVRPVYRFPYPQMKYLHISPLAMSR